MKVSYTCWQRQVLLPDLIMQSVERALLEKLKLALATGDRREYEQGREQALKFIAFLGWRKTD